MLGTQIQAQAVKEKWEQPSGTSLPVNGRVTQSTVSQQAFTVLFYWQEHLYYGEDPSGYFNLVPLNINIISFPSLTINVSL